ncbi:MAG: hypothetical protein LUQ34_01545 [Euryarchaeota archaeon]|nr:hypothetical protein [Euryarchaeota archaeon]
MNEGGEHVLRGYRSIGDVAFDIDGELSTEIGCVVFEVSDKRPEYCKGLISTFNNLVTLRGVRFARTQRACGINGCFYDGQQETTCTLDDVVFTTFFVLDVCAFVVFRARILV